MRRTFILTAALTSALIATSVAAQTAIRCEMNGKVTYGDTPCASGSAATTIAPTRETAEQKAAGKAANDQIRKDTAAVDKRLDDRYKRDTARPVGLAASTDYAKNDKTVADAKGEPKRSGVKVKKSKKPSKKASAKAAKAVKQDNKMYRPAPKA